MVADAVSLEEGKPVALADPKTYRDFRGSWSGYERDCLFHNPDGPAPRFVNAGYVYGVDFDDDGRSAAPADVDGDGDLDLVCLSLQGLRLVENTSPRRHFARVRLAARAGRPLPLNAVVRVTAGGVTQQDYVRVTDGFQTQVPADLHFGLGDADRIDSLEIVWPGTTAPVRFSGLPADRVLVFREGAAGPDVSELPRWPDACRPGPVPKAPYDRTAGGGEAPLAEKGKPAVLAFRAGPGGGTDALGTAAAAFAGRARFAVAGLDAAAAAPDGVPRFLADEALLRAFFGSAAPAPATFAFDAAGRLRRAWRRPLEAGELESLLATLLDDRIPPADIARLGGRLVETGRYEDSLPWLEQAARELPDDPLVHYNLGVACLQTGREADALAAFRRSVQLDAGFARSRHNLAEVLRRAGKFEEAAGHYEEALRIRGDVYDACLGLGDCLLRLGRNEEALLAFDRALAMDRRGAAAMKSKAVVLARLKRVGEAAELLRKVLELAPGDKEAREWLEQMR